MFKIDLQSGCAQTVFFLSCPPIPVWFVKFREYCMGKVKGFAHYYNSDYKITARWR